MKQLKEDSGDCFRDVNAAKYLGNLERPKQYIQTILFFSSYPSEPMFRALLAMHPDIGLSSFDIVGCGSTIGNLLRFCEGIYADFRFDIDRVKNTVFFLRKEDSPTALIRNIRGCGHSFPEAHTAWDPEMTDSISHQRIIQYDFGGLKFLVRSQSDGYVQEVLDSNGRLTTDPNSPPKTNKSLAKASNVSEDDAYSLFGTLRVSSPQSLKGSLHIEIKGRSVPQKAIFDIKARAKGTRRPIDMNEVYRRLWLNQTPYFIFAEHFSGSFEPCDIKAVSVSDEVLKWEKYHEGLLKKYLAIVMEIIAASKRSVNGNLHVTRRGSGPLEIRERFAGANDKVLPFDLRKRGWDMD